MTTNIWDEVIKAAMERNNIGAAIEKLRPIAEELKVAMDGQKDNDETNKKRKRLRRSITVALSAIFNKWGLNLQELLNEQARK